MDCDFMFVEMLLNDFVPLKLWFRELIRLEFDGIRGTRCAESLVLSGPRQMDGRGSQVLVCWAT